MLRLVEGCILQRNDGLDIGHAQRPDVRRECEGQNFVDASVRAGFGGPPLLASSFLKTDEIAVQFLVVVNGFFFGRRRWSFWRVSLRHGGSWVVEV